MADRSLFTNAAALAGANAIAVSIANAGAVPPTTGKVRLFDATLIPDVGTTLAELEGAETELIGYPVGGYPITEFSGATFAPLGGAVVTSDLIHVAYVSGDPVVIGGYWLEDGTTPNGQVREVYVYDPPRSLAVVGDGWPLAVQLGYGQNYGI